MTQHFSLSSFYYLDIISIKESIPLIDMYQLWMAGLWNA